MTVRRSVFAALESEHAGGALEISFISEKIVVVILKREIIL